MGRSSLMSSYLRAQGGIEGVFNVTAMERSILAELSERGGRGQLSRLKDRRPLERLVNKGFVERHALKGQQEEYVLTAIGKKVLDNSRLERRSARDSIDRRAERTNESANAGGQHGGAAKRGGLR